MSRAVMEAVAPEEMEAMDVNPKLKPPDVVSLPRGHNMKAVCCTDDPAVLCWSFCISAIWPFYWCGACHTFEPREEAAVYKFNAPYAHIYVDRNNPDQNIFCINPSLQVKKYSRASYTVNLDACKAAEADGSPLILSGIVTYHVEDPWRYLSSENVHSFISNQGLVVMKEVASKFPYESRTEGGVSLRSADHRNVINAHLVERLQHRCQRVGVTISEFDLTDLSFAPEIAAAMLVKQQAMATLGAKKLLVEGAVGMAHDAVMGLSSKGIHFDDAQKADLVKSLLVMSMSDSGAKPTLGV
mmetsp:Transcript_13942/g.16817  ORF Transcript_13942/g.16817 Transcript_13942/m.16817 type:complete len:299 (-) Transcript_13942:498-1394(-)|eukprot:CAMPEP_0197844404 /NCGR_PEP_ID=MMETSP1438-20131217/1383_1 /TAXON_ID=1461541 /ORGANISM="Pterosperma sp., Strain CCMP1384" /LENGTH=298 /DNA_ID=CAMNT_0043455165 /DNA_START=151 /DNA_END=1047 /DNA_ORIENTATION=+